jgi:hypothetical protein
VVNPLKYSHAYSFAKKYFEIEFLPQNRRYIPETNKPILKREITAAFLIRIKKVKLSHCRPGHALGVPGG